MALTRITKGVIKPNENYDTHNINSTGIVTAIGLDVNGNGDISGNLSVGGVLTYEDVTSIDSVGIITARNGIDCNGDIDVDGHTNLDNVSIAGITTFSNTVHVGTGVTIETNGQATYTGIVTARGVETGGYSDGAGNYNYFKAGRLKIYDNGSHIHLHGGYSNHLYDHSGVRRILTNNLLIYNTASSRYYIGAKSLSGVDLYWAGATNNGIKLSTSGIGVTVFGQLDTTDLDVDGHTNLDNVSIAGVVTATTYKGNGDSITGIHTVSSSPNVSGQGGMCIGNAGSYRFIQSHGSVELKINPIGNGVWLPTNSYVEGSTRKVANISNNADNRLITGADTHGRLNAEANFTYNGTQVDIAGTTDGVLNLDTTDSRGAFIRFGQGGSFHNMVGCADGLVTGLDKQDLAVRATDNFAIATNGDNERLRIDSSGRVRIANTNFNAAANADELVIGTTSGNRGLTIVSGNTGIGALFFADDGSTNVGSLVYEHNTNQMRMNVGGQQVMRLDYVTSNIPKWIIGNDLDTHISLPSANTFAFTTGGTERLRIMSGGAIGIHTTTGSNTVNIGGAAGLGVKFHNFTSGNSSYITVESGDKLQSNVGGTGYFTWVTGGTEKVRFANDGKVGIGTDATGSQLSIGRASGNTGLTLDCYGTNRSRLIFRNSVVRGTETNIDAIDDDLRFVTGSGERLRITNTGQVNIGGDYTQTTYTMKVTGSFAATTKSFVIDHPTKENHSLRYACLEGPENSVYVRGKTSDSVIELPDYWKGLVHEDSITVNVTPIRNHKVWVESINNNSVTIGSDGSEYFYTVFAERKDVDKLEVEVAK